MARILSKRFLSKRPTGIKLLAVTFLFTLVFGFHLGTNSSISEKVYSFDHNSLMTNKQQNTNSFDSAYNSTHLWSLRFANENYFRIARLIQCRVVEYFGGPQPDKIDSCDQSSTNEFSVSNTLEIQKWLYEHQHPADCLNKRFAIIRNFAISGFGSTVHQIVWAFGVALVENRIAVYDKPGNWVRKIS